MRICIDVSAAVHQRAGLGRYSYELTRSLLALNPPDEIIAFYNRASQARLEPPIDRLTRLMTELSDKPWRMNVLLSQLARLPQDRFFPGIDLFHATDHLLPLFSQVKSVFTLNDLTFHLFPHTHRSWNRLYLRMMMSRFLKTADAVIAISECTRQDAIRLYGMEASKILVIYAGVSSSFHPLPANEIASVRQKYGLPEQYLLFVGTIEPRKNLETLLSAIQDLNQRGLELVIAGKKGWRSENFFRKRRDLGLEEHVRLVGFVPEEDLPAIYNGASLFVYPSLYEGFGLPVLEAMACGTPVVCSNTSSLPEVAGEAAILVDPLDADGFSKAMIRVVHDPALRQSMQDRGFAQAAKFSWDQTARQTLAVYHQIQ